MPIIRSSRVLYSGCCLWYFVLWFSSCWSGVELRLMCPVCRMLQHRPQTAVRPSVSCPALQHFATLSHKRHDFREGGGGLLNIKYVFRVSGTFLGAFAKWRKATISFVMSVHPSDCPHGTTRLPFDGFS